MRRALVLLAVMMALGSTAQARPDVLLFDGDATVDLHEWVEHNNAQTVATTVVDLSIAMQGTRSIGRTAFPALGTATVTRADDSMTTVPLAGEMYPPEGSGGFVLANGLGDDGSLYCFRIWDLQDAPTQRPDRITAAFEPAGRFASGFLETPNQVALSDMCYALLHREDWVHTGDFSFTTIP